jgi:hypothetical protein
VTLVENYLFNKWGVWLRINDPLLFHQHEKVVLDSSIGIAA